jgi:hypothetical protein
MQQLLDPRFGFVCAFTVPSVAHRPEVLARMMEIQSSDLSKTCLLVRRRSQLEAPFFRPDETAAVGLTRRA